jgi:hypothetical protein
MRYATKQKQKKFLETIRLTGNIRVAARETGIGRATHYQRWMKDPEYAAAFEEASEDATDAMIEEARRRAQDGWTEPVIYQGEECYAKQWNPETRQFELTDTPLVIRKYDSLLLMFLIKARRPEYRESFKADIQHSGTIRHGEPDLSRLSDEQFEQLRAISHTLHGVNGVAQVDKPDDD